MSLRHHWIPACASVIALALFIAGVLAWRMMSPGLGCPPGTLCALHTKNVAPHHVHPRRAEGLWVLSAMSAAIALATVAPLVRPGRPEVNPRAS